jgi:hypothetical protein
LGEDYWPMTLNFIETHQNQTTEHFELFHILLFYCLEKMQSSTTHSSSVISSHFEQQRIREKLSQIWSFRPKKFSALDFLSILKSLTFLKSEETLTSSQPPQQTQTQAQNMPNPLVDENNKLGTVGSLREQLMTFAKALPSLSEQTEQPQQQFPNINKNL